MGVYKGLTLWEFEQEFIAADRNYFSKDGYEYLYELLEEQDSELDVVSICCDWDEYEDGEALMGDYGHLVEGRGIEEADERLEALIEEIEDRATIVHLANGSYLVSSF